jgi:hypothetical protein
MQTASITIPASGFVCAGAQTPSLQAAMTQSVSLTKRDGNAGTMIVIGVDGSPASDSPKGQAFLRAMAVARDFMPKLVTTGRGHIVFVLSEENFLGDRALEQSLAVFAKHATGLYAPHGVRFSVIPAHASKAAAIAAILATEQRSPSAGASGASPLSGRARAAGLHAGSGNRPSAAPIL